MAKKQAAPAAKPLAGKTVAFVGKIGYKDTLRGELEAVARGQGAAVVDGERTAPDYLVQGEGIGGKPPAASAKIQKKHPGAAVIDVAGLYQLAAPTADEILMILRSGRNDYKFWNGFDTRRRRAAGKIDLSGADLRAADLYGAKLESLTLDGADLRETNLEYAYLHNLRRTKLDKANAKNLYLGNADGCTFRGTVLHKAWMFWGSGNKVTGCDFTGAEMGAARMERGTFVGCTFTGADLSDAQFGGTTFEACDFGKADLSRVHAHKAKFTDATFVRANLHRADLREASLKGADLRNTDLREAVLGGADLTGASVAGADFAGAVLTGATVTGVDFSKAKNYTPPVTRTAGPKLTELAQAAAGAKGFSTTAEVELGANEHATLHLGFGQHGARASSRYYRDRNDTHDWITSPTFEQGLLNLAARWPNGTLRLDTVAAKGSPTVRGPKLKALAVAAWAEAFGVPLASEADLAAQQAAQEAEARQARDALMAQVRAKGVKVWNSIYFQERDRYDLRGADLRGAKLVEFDATSRDLTGAQFAGADLTVARLYGSTLHAADFANANLSSAHLEGCACEKASFVGADLTGAYLSRAKLQGADFTGATLTDAKLDKAQFDEHTTFPAGFAVPDEMVWKGKGKRPGVRAAKAAAPGSMTFDTFFKGLATKVDAGRIEKAAAMLKAERFQLYADVTAGAVAGVVKSQSSAGLVYACRLASDGAFSCGTQNLKPCGGLSGALCKHLLVLVVGLAKAGTLDPATAAAWVGASKTQKPALDKDAASETFLKYKGAEAGDIDWRPTETVPEDFYAM